MLLYPREVQIALPRLGVEPVARVGEPGEVDFRRRQRLGRVVAPDGDVEFTCVEERLDECVIAMTLAEPGHAPGELCCRAHNRLAVDADARVLVCALDDGREDRPVRDRPGMTQDRARQRGKPGGLQPPLHVHAILRQTNQPRGRPRVREPAPLELVGDLGIAPWPARQLLPQFHTSHSRGSKSSRNLRSSKNLNARHS